jgi:predicted small secreted protein
MRRSAIAVLGALSMFLAACATQSGQAAPVSAPAPSTSDSTASPSALADIPGDGTFAVGSDIKPGTYRTAGAASSVIPNCYWERDKDLSGTSDSIIANGNSTGPAIVQISSTDAAFKTSGCQSWTLVTEAAAPPPTLSPAAPAAPKTQPGGDAASVVEAYYAAVNAQDYATAWNLGGSHFASSYATFVADYANTARDSLVVTSVSGDRVYIDLTAYNRDGTVQHFTGYYIVDGGVLTGANIH